MGHWHNSDWLVLQHAPPRVPASAVARVSIDCNLSILYCKFLSRKRKNSVGLSRARPDEFVRESQKFSLACGKDNPTFPRITEGHSLSSMSAISSPRVKHTSLWSMSTN